MKEKIDEIKEEKIVPLVAVSRIQRWHICQQIGVIYYESSANYETLVAIYNDLKINGIIK